ncbi:MAG: diaminopimelate epimerase [Euryarchaeota archaeon]|nr:diaminopimelate epimerase [Euryarchaeota archaeon]
MKNNSLDDGKKDFILFSKMHGLGNDYIVIDETDEEIIPEEKKGEIVKTLCRRGFSVGADGVIFASPATLQDADIQFRIFNSDGSESEMCGNGIRCFSKFVYDNGIVRKDKIRVETIAGIKKVDLIVENGKVAFSKVDMGTSTFKTSKIPMISDEDEFLDDELLVEGKLINMSVVNVGNPHAVIFSPDFDNVPLETLGPAIETHEAFPQKINVHFVDILNKNEIRMITWERGAGITFACGTGATSCALVGFRLGKLETNVLVHLPGGDLNIEIYEKNGWLGAFMSGDSVLVYDGVIEIKI